MEGIERDLWQFFFINLFVYVFMLCPSVYKIF